MKNIGALMRQFPGRSSRKTRHRAFAGEQHAAPHFGGISGRRIYGCTPRTFLVLALSLLTSPITFAAQAANPTPSPTAPKLSPTVEGHWAGTLKSGDAALHIVLHLTKSPDGQLHAKLDSLDQAVYNIEATNLTHTESTVTFEIPNAGATFEGKLTLSHQSLEGTWSQSGVAIPITFHREAPGIAGRKSDALFSAEGTWQGALETPGLRLRLQLHITHDDKKQLVAALDSLDQGVSGLPASKVSQKDSTINFEIPGVGGAYEGAINATKDFITGTWTQSEIPQKLTFVRQDQPLDLARPQNPVKPYPYSEEDVTFPNTKANSTLAGTLTTPRTGAPFPTILLLAGSGPHDRDETLAGHKPFLVLADALTRNGYAVLRYDKRGIALSTGDYANATTEDFASDAEAAITFLKTRRDLNMKKFGIVGHSEGGIIGPMLAVRNPQQISWLVLLAAPALKGEETLLLQSKLIAEASGLSDAQISASLAFDRQAYYLVRQEKDSAALEKKLNDLVRASGMTGALPPPALQSQIRMISSPWFRFFLDYDPAATLKKVTCPVLALDGEKDLQVPSAENLPLIQAALEAGQNKNFEVMEFPGLNHLFQRSETGSPSEYGVIQETFSPDALTKILTWLAAH
jgi:pimeloyl-ACP methyl ester carboxylesterase